MGRRINSKYLTHDGIKSLKKCLWTLGCALQKEQRSGAPNTPKPHEIKAVVPAPQQPLQSCVSAKNMSQTKHVCVWRCFVLILFQAPALESERILSRGERHVEEDAQQEG